MSALGHKPTPATARQMSASLLQANNNDLGRHFRSAPIADLDIGREAVPFGFPTFEWNLVGRTALN